MGVGSPIRVFVAGATGAVGRQLVPLLLEAGHQVTGATRRPERATQLSRLGAEAVVVDLFDPDRLIEAVVTARPEVVIHQVTDLAGGFGPAELEANARVRDLGTAHLVSAASAAGARRVVAQSMAWLYAGSPPWDEDSPLLDPGDALGSVTLRGVLALERRVLETPGVEGIVLRYGRLYGPGTWAPGGDTETDGPASGLPPHPRIHVRASALAAARAVDRGRPGIYDIVDDGGPVRGEKARAAGLVG